MLLITEDHHLVLLLRKGRPHSKYFTLWCSCGRSRRRKDGTCKHQRDVLEHHVKPEARYRVQPVRGDDLECLCPPHQIGANLDCPFHGRRDA